MSQPNPTKPSLSIDDKIQIALSNKENGNQCFLRADYKAALASYHIAVLYLSGLEKRSILGLVGENSGQGKPQDLSSDEEEEEEDASHKLASDQKHLSLVYSNMAACYIKQKTYTKAIQVADKALVCDSKNLKAKFRKAQALRLNGDIYQAKEWIEKWIAQNPTHQSSFEAELASVQQMIQKKQVEGNNKWRGFLGKNPTVFQVSSESVTKATSD